MTARADPARDSGPATVWAGVRQGDRFIRFDEVVPWAVDEVEAAARLPGGGPRPPGALRGMMTRDPHVVPLLRCLLLWLVSRIEWMGTEHATARAIQASRGRGGGGEGVGAMGGRGRVRVGDPSKAAKKKAAAVTPCKG